MDPFPGAPVDLWSGMAAYLRGIDASLGTRPRAVLVVSGHWDTDRLMGKPVSAFQFG